MQRCAMVQLALQMFTVYIKLCIPRSVQLGLWLRQHFFTTGYGIGAYWLLRPLATPLIRNAGHRNNSSYMHRTHTEYNSVLPEAG